MKTYKWLIGFAVLCLTACDPTHEQYEPVCLQSSITHVQPMTGLVLWNEKASKMDDTHGPCIALEFTYIPPCRLVQGKIGTTLLYDWSYLEYKLNDAASRGHQMVVRFPLCYPSNRNNCIEEEGGTYVPDYIRAMDGYHETYAADPGGDGPTWYPDWSHSELKWFVKQFYTDLAEHYNNDARIAFVEVGFGHWGEYHTYGTVPLFGKNFPTRRYQHELFQILNEQLTIPWLISVDAGDDTYTDVCTYLTTKKIPFGLFDDSFMHAGHEITQGEGWNEQCWQSCGMERWKKGVCGGEISYYSSADQHNFLRPTGMYGVTWEEAAAKYHISFMICNDAPDGRYFTPERVQEAGLASGYRFRVLSCETNGVDTRIRVTNTGIAPIYRDAYFTVNDTRANESLRGLLPGEERTVHIRKAVATPHNVQIRSDFILPSEQIEFEVE